MKEVLRVSQIKRGSSLQSLMSTMMSGDITVLRAPAAFSAMISHHSSLFTSKATAGGVILPAESLISGFGAGFFSKPRPSTIDH